MNKKTGAGAIIRLKVREKGGVFRTRFKRTINSLGNDMDFMIQPYLIVPANADVIMTAEAQTAGDDIAAGFHCILASVV